MTAVSLTQFVDVPDHVLLREVDSEAVLLNLHSETYFGLEEVGTRMWHALANASTIRDAYIALQSDYDVDAESLKADLLRFVAELADAGLVTVTDPV